MEHKTNLHKTGFQSQNNNFFNSKNYPPSNLPEVQYFQQNDNHQHQSTRILPNRTSLNYNQNFNYTQANDLNAGNRNFYQDTNASRNPFPSSSSLQVPNVQNQGYPILQKESTYLSTSQFNSNYRTSEEEKVGYANRWGNSLQIFSPTQISAMHYGEQPLNTQIMYRRPNNVNDQLSKKNQSQQKSPSQNDQDVNEMGEEESNKGSRGKLNFI